VDRPLKRLSIYQIVRALNEVGRPCEEKTLFAGLHPCLSYFLDANFSQFVNRASVSRRSQSLGVSFNTFPGESLGYDIAMNSAISALVVLLTTACAVAQTPNTASTADEIVAKMMQLDAQRLERLNGYTVTRHYVAVNQQHKAEMMVGVTCGGDGVKQFTILSEEGSHVIRKHLFYKMLKEETEASRRDVRDTTRIIPSNYTFQLLGKDTVEGRPAYVLQLTPREENKYLINGKIWVDALDYAIVRIEGRPARSPSFWTRNVHFVHTYQKVGPFWFAASTHFDSQLLFFGASELVIENSGYVLNSGSGVIAGGGNATR
jgi:MucB/RseB N-terminal domain